METEERAGDLRARRPRENGRHPGSARSPSGTGKERIALGVDTLNQACRGGLLPGRVVVVGVSHRGRED